MLGAGIRTLPSSRLCFLRRLFLEVLGTSQSGGQRTEGIGHRPPSHVSVALHLLCLEKEHSSDVRFVMQATAQRAKLQIQMGSKAPWVTGFAPGSQGDLHDKVLGIPKHILVPGAGE